MAATVMREPAQKRADRARKRREYQERVQKRNQQITSAHRSLDESSRNLTLIEIPEEIIGEIMKFIDIFDACHLTVVLPCVFNWENKYPNDIYKDVWRNTMLSNNSPDLRARIYAKAKPHHDNPIIAREVISFNGFALEYVSDKLKNDKEIVLIAVDHTGRAPRAVARALFYASDTLKNDVDVVLTAVTSHGAALEYASDTLKNNEEVVMAAIREEKYREFDSALEYASDELRDNKAVVLAAIELNPRAYEYASDELKGDYDVLDLWDNMVYTY